MEEEIRTDLKLEILEELGADMDGFYTRQEVNSEELRKFLLGDLIYYELLKTFKSRTDLIFSQLNPEE